MIRKIQLGKNGITANFIESVKNQFKNSRIVKISVLKSFCRDREELKKINEELLKKLGKNINSKVIGFVIVLRKRGKFS